MRNFIIVLLAFFVFFETKGQTIIPAVNNVGGGNFRNALYDVDFSIGETSIKTINASTVQISEGVIQRTEATCTTPSLVISGSLSVCASVSGFYSIKNPTRTSIYTWSTTGQSAITSGQGTSRIFVTFGQTVQDQISVTETSKAGCVGQVNSVQVSQNAGRYSIPSIDLNCSTTLFSVPVLTSTVPSGITAMDLTLAYDQALVTPTGISFLGNVVRQSYANNAISLYTDFNEAGVIRVSISYNGLAPVTANFLGAGTIIGFTFNRLNSFNPGTTTPIGITELIEGNVSGVNYQCGSLGTITLKNNEISGQVLNYFNLRPLAYNVAAPTQFNATQITATDIYCQPYSYSVVPDLTGSFKFNLDKGEKIAITRDVPGSYYSATALNVQSVINSNDAVSISSALIRPFPLTTESWKQINNDPLKLAKVYAMDVDMDGLVTSLDLYYVQKRSVLQMKEYPQAWNYTDGVPNNTTDLSKDWIFVNNDKFNQLAAPLTKISILPSLSDCMDEPIPSQGSCAPTAPNSFRGILLGDVDGNWNAAPLNSNAIRSSGENQLIVALDSIIAINGGYLIPLHLQYADSVKAIDFNFDYDSTRFIVTEVKPTFDPIAKHFIWNNFNKSTVLAGAYSADTFGTAQPIYYLKLLSSVPITQSSFKEFKSYINGSEVPVVYREALVTGNSFDQLSSYINVYPNPTAGTLSVIGRNWGTETITVGLYSSSGQQVETFEIPATSDIYSELDLSQVTPGVYFLKLQSDKLTKVIKLIKQ